MEMAQAAGANQPSTVYGYQFEAVPAVKPGAVLGIVPGNDNGSQHIGEIESVFKMPKW